MSCEKCGTKVQLVKGVAYKIVNGRKIDVLEITAPNCECGFDYCNCALILTSPVDESVWVKFIDNEGEWVTVSKATWDTLVESGDFSDYAA